MTLSYFDRLPPALKAVYLQSDGITWIRLSAPDRLLPAVESMREALKQEKQKAVAASSQGLCDSACQMLRVDPPVVRVLRVRPTSCESELHGLYEREEGKRPIIKVWMRTAKQKRVVAFRTFLRTLIHELCHHLDYDLIHLADSLHTEGFFKRESSLFDQLTRQECPSKTTSKGASPPDPLDSGAGPQKPLQLDLPFAR